MIHGVESIDKTSIEEMEDEILTKVARTGDRDAFGELVRRYRNKAINWAQTVVKDTGMSEDIVQEALIKAFLNMGDLIDESRFSPWLKKIVLNQALMKLRGNNQYMKVYSFTQMEKYYQNNNSINIHNIFDIIHYVTQNVSKNIQHSFENPEGLLLKKEMMEGIRDLLYCLSKREREVFEAYFFQEITPKEIAELFKISVGNIYTTLSRTRVKLRRERTQIFLNDYFKKELTKGVPKKKILDNPSQI